MFLNEKKMAGRFGGPIFTSGVYSQQNGVPAGDNANTVSGRAFGGDLAFASGAAKRSVSLLTPGLDSSKLRALATGERATLSNHNNTFTTGQVSAFLSGHAMPPSQTGPWAAAKPMDLVNHDEPINGAVPITRIIVNKEMHDLPGIGELCILKKPLRPSHKVELSEQRIAGGTSGWGHTQAINPHMGKNVNIGDNEAADLLPYVAFNVRAWNLYIARHCWDLFQRHPKKYYELTPLKIWAGVPEDPDLADWTGFMLDGIVRLEEMMDGPSTKLSDAYGTFRSLGAHIKGNPGTPAAKQVNIVRGGNVRAQNIFESRGITRGSQHSLLLTQRPMPNGELNFCLTSKGGVLAQGVTSVKTTFKLDKQYATVVQQRTIQPVNKRGRPTGAAAVDAYHVALPDHGGFAPFQLFAVTQPDGGSLPTSFFEWVDSWLIKHYDALPLRFCREVHEPYQFAPLPAINSPDDKVFQPLTDGTRAMQQMPIQNVIMHPEQDGIMALL